MINAVDQILIKEKDIDKNNSSDSSELSEEDSSEGEFFSTI
jgi:hypothetical protein